MVDVDTALRASAYSGKKGGGSKGGDKKSTSLEPFDPSAHAEKERADAISMWLVIFFGLSVALLMRFYMMPGMDNSQQSLWLLPVLMIALIRPLHQLVVPTRFFELFTTGNWVRASFLYLFTWLALSFALVNPPIADIAAPHLAGAIDIADTEGISGTDLDGKDYEISISQPSITVILGLGVRDNVDALNSTINITIHKCVSDSCDGLMEPLISEYGLVSKIATNGPSETFDSVDPNDWTRGLKKNTLTGDFSGPKVAPHSEDVSMAWDLCPDGCTPGKYLVQISLVEEGDMIPWKDGDNTWEGDYTIRIQRTS
ncbi:MAG: hypothetical protein QGI73_01480 [Candidatus Thalassarchaeaceae archaeon]|jgi:hypothetical protein|nr:hypothetical protein [Candidatus Thalassarchaeaceae archaeon]